MQTTCGVAAPQALCPGSCPAPDSQADAIGEQKPEWMRPAAAKADAIGEQ